MTFAPDDLTKLNAYWKSKGGVGLGIVGDSNHTTGYHLGRDRIYDGSGPGQGDADYSVHDFPRDRAGLTNAASGIDLGKLGGTFAGLRRFSIWLVEQLVARAPGWDDVREVVYSPDGSTVLRWHRGHPGGPVAYPKPYSSRVAAHLTHTHVSYFRDTRGRDKVALFRGYFEQPAAQEGGDMPPLVAPDVLGQIATIKKTANIRSAPKIADATLVRYNIAEPETWRAIGWVKGQLDPETGSDLWLIRAVDLDADGGRYEYTAKGNVTTITPAADPTPFDQADIDAAKLELTTKINAARQALAAADASIEAAITKLT